MIVKPETVIRWHRAGFRSFWRWKSRRRGGRPKVPFEIRQLIREMSLANPLWGAPRIHGELLKLGIDVGQTSVAKYMARHRRPPSLGWKTFIRNHADGIAAMDLFVVPTLSFRLLYGLLILSHGRRQILWLGVTTHPTAEWVARQLTEACGWEWTPSYIIRDRDRVYGEIFTPRFGLLAFGTSPLRLAPLGKIRCKSFYGRSNSASPTPRRSVSPIWLTRRCASPCRKTSSPTMTTCASRNSWPMRWCSGEKHCRPSCSVGSACTRSIRCSDYSALI
jgi:hypothetical protein